jgi:predicted DCC family thiol-disulfide oxidoreductase YuxK
MTTELTIYYDGACPLCLAEIHLLKQHNDRNLLAFIDLQSLDASTAIIDCTLALELIHAKLGDETIIVGPEVFFEAYKRTNLTLMKYLFSFSVIRYCYAKCYVFFAKYRHPISRAIGPTLLKVVQKKYAKK